MAAHYYWIPKNHHALYDQANQTGDYLSDLSHRERMGFAPSTPQGQWIDEEFFPKLHHFNETFLDWLNTAERAPFKITRLYEAERAFKPAYRQLYTGFLKSNPLVVDDNLVRMGLPKSREHTGGRDAAVPDSFPHTNVVLPGPAVVEFHFYDTGSGHRAKPAGVHGAEIKWAILDTPPTEWSELTQSELAIRTPHRLTFDFCQRGKTLYFALRWENTRGEKGPWSEIQHTIIA